MRRALLVTVVGIGLACGGGERATESADLSAEPAGHEENRPPYIETFAIVPAEPTVEDSLTVGLRVIDPDRDSLSIDLTWYRNGAVHDDSGRQSIDPGEFERGDSVWVEAVIDDGTERLEVETEPVEIANAPPRPSAVRITPPEPSAADLLEVEIAGADADGDSVRWSYRWLVDGQTIEGMNGTRIAPGLIHRGARVAVEVSGNDGIEDGEWISSDTVSIANAGPKVTTQPVYGLASPGRYVYEVRAEDADGDQPLRFELAEGPPGMSIDAASGLLTWTLPSDAKGSYPIQIGVSDAHGGRAVQRYALEVSWQAEPPPVPANARDADPEKRPASAEAEPDEAGEDAADGADEDDEADDEGDF